MTTMTKTRPLRRLCRDRTGLAMMEFALAAPIMLIVMASGLEAANMALAVLKVHQIAATTADNVARVRDSISESDVNEALLGGVITGSSLDFANRGRIVVSDVMTNGQASPKTGQTILWQRCTGKLNTTESAPAYGTQGKGATDNSLQSMGKAPRSVSPSPDSVLVFAEVTYRYQPLISATIFGTPILRSESAFTVRERASEPLTAGASGTVASVCTRYDL